jgi:LDH2 family malate/lactate/ureidoglycolate dehydrogenase
MKVSRNELNTALKRAYEGAGYDIGDYEDAAELITWAEMCGFKVFSNLTLPPSGPKGSATPRLVYEGSNNAIIDAGGADVCQYGSLACDLVFAKASKAGMATVQLENCQNPGLVLRNLAQIALRGACISAYWYDDDGYHGASFESGIGFPDYWNISTNASENSIGTSTITLLCSSQAGLLANASERQTESGNASRQQKSSAQAAVNFDESLENGISVDEAQWQALNAAAWPILVSTTGQSRLGAGPG